MGGVSRSCGRDGLRLAYFVDGVYDSGCILPPEFQSNISIPFSIDEIDNLLKAGEFEVPREALPLSEDVLFCDDELSITVS